MISTVAELLQSIVEKEKDQLASVPLKHAPTIGDMHEGLTKDILDRAVPSNIGLQVVNGFVVDGNDGMSPQIDCMLVKNIEEQIPYTDHYKCHIKDVIAVIEVKKSLYSADLSDAYWKLYEVQKLFREFVQSDTSYRSPSMNSAMRAFALVTKRPPPRFTRTSRLCRSTWK